MRKGGRTIGYYNTSGALFGFQAGFWKFGYALIFMTKDDLDYIDRLKGWEIGTGPSIVVLDKGAVTALTTTTGKKGVYAIFFDQKGLMAGIGIQGAKITKINIKP